MQQRPGNAVKPCPARNDSDTVESQVARCSPTEKQSAPKAKVNSIQEWYRWTKEESHLMTLPMFSQLPGVTAAETLDKKLALAVIRRNPLYWVAWAGNCITLAGGCLVHGLFRQHSPVRKDEVEAEHEARVQWIYANDFTYSLSMLLDLWALANDVDILLFHRHVWNGHPGAIGTMIGFLLLLFTILGNVAFYESMRRRSVTGVRACIAGNAGFAFAMLVALVNVARKKGLKMVKKSWFLRAIAVFFAILALPTYAKLWNIYADGSCGIFTQMAGSKYSRFNRRKSILVTTFLFCAVAGILLLAFSHEGHAVWETFG